jgi:hypothetical protein
MAMTNTLIVISEDKLIDWFYQKEEDKIKVLRELDYKKDRILFVWVWKFRSDVFEITEEFINLLK